MRSLLAVLTLALAASAQFCPQLIIPGYGEYPTDLNSAYWGPIIENSHAYFIVLSVQYGPGPAVDANYEALVHRLREVGKLPVGIVPANPSGYNLASIQQNMDAWNSFYNITSFYLDGANNNIDASTIALYGGAYEYAKGLDSNGTVILATGWNTVPWGDAQYMNFSDVFLNFKGTNEAYFQQFTAVNDWTANYDPSRFAQIIYATPTTSLSDTLARSQNYRAGHVFISDRATEGNALLPSYWSQLHNAINVLCGIEPTTPPTTGEPTTGSGTTADATTGAGTTGTGAAATTGAPAGTTGDATTTPASTTSDDGESSASLKTVSVLGAALFAAVMLY